MKDHLLVCLYLLLAALVGWVLVILYHAWRGPFVQDWKEWYPNERPQD